jgi:toxin CcdB
MSQFILYKNEDNSTNNAYPYFVDIQNSLLSDLNSRLVIPLSSYSDSERTDVKKLCPLIDIEEGQFVLLTHQMTSVPRSILKTEITSIKHYRYQIIDALDMLVSGI